MVEMVGRERQSGREVFISYARESGQSEAEELHRALDEAGVATFLDSEAVGPGERIPERVFEGLLGARVLVALVDAAYFTRRYCVEELGTGLAAYRPLLRAGAGAEELEEAAAAIVVAVASGGDRPEELERLPP